MVVYDYYMYFVLYFREPVFSKAAYFRKHTNARKIILTTQIYLYLPNVCT